MVAGLLALCVGWIPIIGQALAAVLGTIALIATAVSLVCNIALAATGYGSWDKVLLDAISLATFGIGRAVATGARASQAATRGASRLAAGRAAASSPAVRTAAGLPGGSSRTAIRAMTGSDDIANLSRTQARNLVQLGNRTRPVSLTAPFSAAATEIRQLPSQVRSIFSAPGAQVWSEIPSAAQSIRNSRSATEVLARLYPNADTLADVSVRAGLHPAIAGAAEVTQHAGRAAALTATGAGAQVASTFVDTYQSVDVGWDRLGPQRPEPADGLQLPRDPGVR